MMKVMKFKTKILRHKKEIRRTKTSETKEKNSRFEFINNFTLCYFNGKTADITNSVNKDF